VADELLRITPAPLLLLRPLLVAAHQPLPLVQREPASFAGAPPPPTVLDVTGQEAQLIRLALETLLWDTPREEHLTAPIQSLLSRLPAAPAATPGETPAAHAPPSQDAAMPAGQPASVDHRSIAPGSRVFAHRATSDRHTDAGAFVGVVQEVVECDGLHYVRVQGGLGQAREHYLPIRAVRLVMARQVHLNLSAEDLVGQSWHRPPAPSRGKD
jgi:hypothetical protein